MFEQLNKMQCFFVKKQALLNTIKSHESVIKMLVSKSEELLQSSFKSVSGDQLMNKYRSLHDRVKVALKIFYII